MRKNAKAAQIECVSERSKNKCHEFNGGSKDALVFRVSWIVEQIKRLRDEGIISRAKALIKKIIRKIIDEIKNQHKLHQLVKKWSYRFGLDASLRRLYARVELKNLHTMDRVAECWHVEIEPYNLNPRAQKIYTDLILEIVSNTKVNS
jgi:DNA-binding Lrp family transcriptional regulator